MNALVKKEIRLLLPSWLTVLLLGALLPWVWKPDGRVITVSPVVLFFGAILIGVDSFGREFSLGTFSWLISQPVERRKIWCNKIIVLAVGVTIIYIVQLVSYELWLHWGLPTSPGPHSYITLGDNWWSWNGETATLMLVAACGGLWTTLLLRQVAAAMWITFLAPVALLVMIGFLLSDIFPSTPNLVAERVLLGAAGVYILAGFLWARWLFYRAQDVGWSGGVIALPEWAGFAARAGDVISPRKRRPIFALLKKEFQLQQVALTGAAGLLVLHLGVILLREQYKIGDDSLGVFFATVFWVLWLVMAPLVGGMAVAEERRLGVLEGQLCLPVPRQVQFAIKLVLTVLLGAFLGGVMPMLVERVAVVFGSHHSIFSREVVIGGEFGAVGFALAIVALAAGLTFVSFYASTLARSFLQALGLAMATYAGWVLIATWIVNTKSFLGVVPRSSPILQVIVATPTILVTLRWLGYLNFTDLQHGWPLWRRNLLGLAGVVLFIIVGSALIYHRAWEAFGPAEPPHGAPKFALSNPPALQGDDSGTVLVRSPDGGVWLDSLGYPFLVEGRRYRWKEAWWVLVHPMPGSDGPRQFVAGSNWVSLTTQHIDRDWIAVGIQGNGTLWISSGAKANIWAEGGMVRSSDETNWERIVRLNPGFLLLKKDGSLWQWATVRFERRRQTNWPTSQASNLQRIGTDSDWAEIFGDWSCFARKTDGSTWAVRIDWAGKAKLERRANLDQTVLQTISRMADGRMAYVAKDGTLWVGENTGSFRQMDKGTNWVGAAVTWKGLVALKADGTLWQWMNPDSTAEGTKVQPRRLSFHNDWVGLTVSRTAVVSLAADGSLWYWPNTGLYDGVLLKAPKQPQLLANVFRDTH